jgi:HlyD family secretion protein
VSRLCESHGLGLKLDVLRPDLKRKSERRKRFITFACIASLSGLLVWAVVASIGGSVARADRVTISVVRKGDFVRSVRGTGKLVPSERRWIVARSDSNVDRVLKRPGERVGVDTVILELSNPEVSDAFLAADAAWKAAKSDHVALVAKLRNEILDLQSEAAAKEGEYRIAQVEDEAYRRGYESGVISSVQHRKAAIAAEQKHRDAELARQRVAQMGASMRAQIEASEARLAQFARTRELREVAADALRVRAGVAGVVQSIQVEEGQRVAAGANLARVAQSGSLIAELRIPESQAADVTQGQDALVEISGVQVPGKLKRLDPVVEKGTLLAEITLLGPLPGGARSEQSVDGTIRLEEIRDALFVDRPVNSIPLSAGSVFKVVESGAAVPVPVQFGKDSVNQIQILNGLSEGDRIILSDTSAFKDAGRVEFN